MDIFKDVTFHLSGDVKTTTLSFLKEGGARRRNFLSSSISLNIVGEVSTDSDDNDVGEANEVRFNCINHCTIFCFPRFGEYLTSMKIGLLKVSEWVKCFLFSPSYILRMKRYVTYL